MTVDQLINRLSILIPEQRKRLVVFYDRRDDIFKSIKDVEYQEKDHWTELKP